MSASSILSNSHVQLLISSGYFRIWVNNKTTFVSCSSGSNVCFPSKSLRSISYDSVTVSFYLPYGSITCWVHSPFFSVNLF